MQIAGTGAQIAKDNIRTKKGQNNKVQKNAHCLVSLTCTLHHT
jgi:hypothetical protein